MKRLLLPLLAALALPIAIQVEEKYPIGEWIPWEASVDRVKFKFLGCKKG